MKKYFLMGFSSFFLSGIANAQSIDRMTNEYLRCVAANPGRSSSCAIAAAGSGSSPQVYETERSVPSSCINQVFMQRLTPSQERELEYAASMGGEPLWAPAKIEEAKRICASIMRSTR